MSHVRWIELNCELTVFLQPYKTEKRPWASWDWWFCFLAEIASETVNCWSIVNFFYSCIVYSSICQSILLEESKNEPSGRDATEDSKSEWKDQHSEKHSGYKRQEVVRPRRLCLRHWFLKKLVSLLEYTVCLPASRRQT